MSKTYSNSREPQEVDRYVGQRIRVLRTERGLSQSELASAIHITYQQLQKYESGRNRVSASRLYSIACIFEVNVSYFFDKFDTIGMAAE